MNKKIKKLGWLAITVIIGALLSAIFFLSFEHPSQSVEFGEYHPFDLDDVRFCMRYTTPDYQMISIIRNITKQKPDCYSIFVGNEKEYYDLKAFFYRYSNQTFRTATRDYNLRIQDNGGRIYRVMITNLSDSKYFKIHFFGD